MANKRKRKARRRSSRTIQPGLPPEPGGISNLLSMITSNAPPGLTGHLESRLDTLVAAKNTRVVQATNPNQGCDELDWRGGMDYILENISQRDKLRAEKLHVTFQLITPEGYLVAHCKDGGKTFSTSVLCDAQHLTVDAVCDCSSPANLCVHAGAVARFALGQLDEVDSPVRKRIIEELGLIENPDLIPGNVALALLDEYLETSGERGATEEVFAMPGPTERVVWRILATSSTIELRAVLQKPKKRGNGWTKGREIRPETLLSGQYELSPIDRKVLATSRGSYYYQRIDTFEAISVLVGHDCVECNGEPATVVGATVALEVVRNPDTKLLQVDFEPHGDLFSYDAGLIVVSGNLIKVIPCDRKQFLLVTSARRGELTVPESRAAELFKRMQSISKDISVRLPADAATTKHVKVDPVLRLKSFKDGTLRCGLRVRVDGRLQQPGHGCLTRFESTSKALILHQRDASAEVERCQSIRAELEFPEEHQLGPWDCGFHEFSDSIDFLGRLGARGDELGIEALWDEDSVEPVNILGSITPSNLRVEVKRKKDWFGIEGGFELGGTEFTFGELLANVDSEPAKGFTELRPGMWAKISERLRKRLLELRDASHANRSKLEVDITAAPILQSLGETELDIKASKEWDACVKRMANARKIKPNPSKDFAAELRDYQLEGYRWMRRLAEWGVGACLADDMGLGKTVQTLAVLLDRSPKGPTLVIAPTSVGFNWQRETERFTPTLNSHLYRETERANFLESTKAGDVVICSYGLALRDAEHLAKVEWGTLVLDEAQFVKNARSKTAQAIRTISADWKLALTGTPVENHLGELWSLFRMISPGVFGSWEQFRKRFASPIEKDNDPDRRKALSRLIQPFLLRRTKSEVLKDLPERTEINLHVDLSSDERRRYDEMRLAAVGELDQIVGAPDANDQRFRILAILTRLRQLACHIGLVDENWQGESAKLSLLVEKVMELKDEGHRVLIFSQFTKYLALIRQTLEAADVTYEYLDGSTSAKARQACVDRFQEGNTDAFLISLKAGGTGLNLTAADYVIHMDPWWNPAVEDQATDRSHRIGQTRPVIVYRIISRGTVEDEILSLHADKRNLVSSVMDGTQKAGSLSTHELMDLIRTK